MILATTVTFIVEKVDMTCTFTEKWLDHLLLMTYLVTIATDHPLTSLKMYGRNEGTATEKWSGANVLSSRKKKLRKPYGGWHPLPTPPVRPMVK